MGNKTEVEPHSKEYFGEQRDYWWNHDFVELMSKRWSLPNRKMILDVGCGIGHWGQLLSKYAPTDAQLYGIDREDEWVKKAIQRAKVIEPLKSFTYKKGLAENIPFEAETFDFVTCQTVLIHMSDPKKVMREMYRVLKPGGMIAVAEPNNLARNLVNGNLDHYMDMDKILEVAKFQYICEKGKENLGLGYNSIGDLVPQYFNEIGINNIKTYLSDKVFSFIPPYCTPDEQVSIEQDIAWEKREFWIWSKDETYQYFIAGGGDHNKFTDYWNAAIYKNRLINKLIAENKYANASGCISYLISGDK